MTHSKHLINNKFNNCLKHIGKTKKLAGPWLWITFYTIQDTIILITGQVDQNQHYMSW